MSKIILFKQTIKAVSRLSNTTTTTTTTTTTKRKRMRLFSSQSIVSSSSSFRSSSSLKAGTSPSKTVDITETNKMKYCDTHCHMEMILEKLAEEKNKTGTPSTNYSFNDWILSVRAKEEALGYEFEKMLTIACSPANWIEIEKLLAEREEVFGAFGIHPLNANLFDDRRTIDSIRKIYEKFPLKMKAIGECGLDYYVKTKEWGEEEVETCPIEWRNVQKKAFIEQIELSKSLGLALVIHARDSGSGECERDCLNILKTYASKGQKIHVHCFTGSIEFARELLSTFENLRIGFTGVCTFKNAKKIRDVIEIVPLNRLLLETDGPYMSPSPFRGRVCEPSMIPKIAEEIARVKNVQIEDVFLACRENTRDTYGF